MASKSSKPRYRVRRNNNNKLSLNNNSNNNNRDPVMKLPGDLVAICLSFVGFQDLLSNAQLVCHAWRDAIDGGQPAVWHHEVCMDDMVTGAQLAHVVRKSHGAIWTLKLQGTWEMTDEGLTSIFTLSDLRVLHITIGDTFADSSDVCETFSSHLSSFPQLECFNIEGCLIESLGSDTLPVQVDFPTLQYLTTVKCDCCGVQGLRNLPSLTSITMVYADVVDAELEAWPASIREVSIRRHAVFSPRLLDRIAALQHQLVVLDTDWSFVTRDYDGHHPAFFILPYNQLSFLSSFSTLQRISVIYDLTSVVVVPPVVPPAALFNYLGAIQSLRQLSICIEGYCANFVLDEYLPCLAQLTNLQDFSLSALSDSTFYAFGPTDLQHCLRHISAIPNLRSLSIACPSITDYSLVETCGQLRSLHVMHPAHQLSCAEVQAITRLQHLETLDLCCRFVDPADFARFCTMHLLRRLEVKYERVRECPDPVYAFSDLPALKNLHTLHVVSIKAEDASEFVDCLVQMPKLRHITIAIRQLSKEEEAKVREALPLLETLNVID